MIAAQNLVIRRTSRGWLRSLRLDRSWWYYLVAGIGIALHMTFALSRYTWYQRLLACGPLIILLFLLRQATQQSYKNVPIPLLVALQIYIFYSVPQFTQDGITLWGGEYFEPSQYAITQSLVLVIAGELLFMLGFTIATRMSWRSTTLFYRLNPTPTLRWRLAVLFYALLGFAIYSLSALRAEYVPVLLRYTVGTLLNPYLGLILILFLGLTYERKSLVILGHIMAIAMAMIGFIQGLLGGMIGPFFALFLSKWIWGKEFKIRSVVLIILAAILINPVKDEFRMLAWVEKDVSSIDRVVERLEDWARAFDSVWIEGTSDRTPVTSTASRTNDLLPFAQSIDYVPDIIPYNRGDGLVDAVLFWIPRVIWPDKKSSSDLVYNRYAVEFGFMDLEGTKSTTVGASVFTEGYWNFDKYGVLAFLFTYGVILGFLFGNNGKSESVSLIICVVYVAPSIFVLQALTVAVASLFSFMVAAIAALWALKFAAQFLNAHAASLES
jgi:hypothetical protein